VGLLNGDVGALQRDYDHMHTSTGRSGASNSTSSSEGHYPASTTGDSGYDITASDSAGREWREQQTRVPATVIPRPPMPGRMHAFMLAFLLAVACYCAGGLARTSH